MNFENLLVDQKNNIGIITINRPSKLNALNKKTIEELHVAFKNLNNNKEIKVIIITGSGEKAFVAGADISEFANFSIEEGTELARKGQEILFNFVQNLDTPVIGISLYETLSLMTVALVKLDHSALQYIG